MKKRPGLWWIKHSVRVKCFSERRKKNLQLSWKAGSFQFTYKSFTEHLSMPGILPVLYVISLTYDYHYTAEKNEGEEGVALPKMMGKWPERHKVRLADCWASLCAGHVWHLVILFSILMPGTLTVLYLAVLVTYKSLWELLFKLFTYLLRYLAVRF